MRAPSDPRRPVAYRARSVLRFTDRLRSSALGQRIRGNPYALRLKRGADAVIGPREFARGYRFAKRLEPAPAALPQPTPSPLEEYFDAHLEGPGIWKHRHYFEIYHRHLSKFRGRPVNVVEIGIFSGGSLGMWLDYFGPESRVYGVDVEPACRTYESDRVGVFIGDQADPEFWRKFLSEVPDIDVVIDDGGHRHYQQRVTLEALLPRMRPGGVYICEDVRGAAQPFHAFVDGLSRPLNHVERNAPPTPSHQHIGSVHRYPLIVVIEKPDSLVEEFRTDRRGTEWQPFL